MKILTNAQLEAASLKLLVDIQNLVRERPQAARFGLSSLARDLRRMGESAELLILLKLLTTKEYLAKDVSAVYELTELGWNYAPPQPPKAQKTPFLAGIADTTQRRPARSRAT